MERNWLIRTSKKKILGPVSKKKIRELIQQGALDPEDEVCSGNGYWFRIKEETLVEKYIHGDTPQEFNMIAEAKTVLSPTGKLKSLIPWIFLLVTGLSIPHLNLKAEKTYKKKVYFTSPPLR